MSIGVLVLHHSGVLGGASRSLFEVVAALHGEAVQFRLVTPKGGVSDCATAQGIETITPLGMSQFDNTTFGHYRGRRWLILLRELAFLPSTCVAIWTAWRRWGREIKVIHANEYNLLFAAILAKIVFRVPVVMHVRSLQASGNRWRAATMRFFSDRLVDRVVAIDSAVAASLSTTKRVSVIYNGQALPETKQGAKEDEASGGGLRVGIVANFVAYKGLFEFVEAARICLKEKGLTDVRFVVFGAGYRRTTGLRARVLQSLGFVRDIQSEVEGLVEREGMVSALDFRGFVSSMERIYGAIDVLCFPSHLDAVGRPVFEAALFQRPSIVALRSRRTDDSIEHGRTGLIIPERDARALADAIEYFREHPEAVRSMGAAALELALERFDVTKNAQQLLGLYRDLAGGDIGPQSDTDNTPAQVGRGAAPSIRHG